MRPGRCTLALWASLSMGTAAALPPPSPLPPPEQAVLPVPPPVPPPVASSASPELQAPAGLMQWSRIWLRRGEDEPSRVLSELEQAPAWPGVSPRVSARVLARTRGQVAARSALVGEVLLALEALRLNDPQQRDPLTRADSALVLAVLADVQGDNSEAERQAQRADEAYQQVCGSEDAPRPSCEPLAWWTVLRLIGRQAENQGLALQARAVQQRALTLATAWGDKLSLAISLAKLANLNHRLGEPALAHSQMKEAERLAVQHHDVEALISVRIQQSHVAARDGEPQQVAQKMEMAWHLAKSLGSPRLEATILTSLSDSWLRSGRLQQARDAVARALPVMRRHGDMQVVPVLLHNSGLVRLRLGDVARGRADLETALSLWHKAGAKGTMMLAMREASEALADAGDVRGALDLLHREQALRNDIDNANLKTLQQQLQQQHRAEIQQAELARLARDNQLQSSRLANAELLHRLWALGLAVLALALAVVGMMIKRGRDINRKLQQTEALLRVQSERDALTGLANRRHLRAVLELAVPQQAFRGALLLLDVDHFKAVNDRYGHAVGDEVLVEVARRLAGLVRGDDLVCRWGGEEFLIMAPELGRDGLEALARRVLHGVGDSPMLLSNGQRLVVTVSVGHACFPLPGQPQPLHWEQALHWVDLALYLAKTRGRDRAIGWRSIHAGRDSVADIERDLGAAQQQGEVALCEQHRDA